MRVFQRLNNVDIVIDRVPGRYLLLIPETAADDESHFKLEIHQGLRKTVFLPLPPI